MAVQWLKYDCASLPVALIYCYLWPFVFKAEIFITKGIHNKRNAYASLALTLSIPLILRNLENIRYYARNSKVLNNFNKLKENKDN